MKSEGAIIDLATRPGGAARAAAAVREKPQDEWSGLVPTPKDMGLVQFTLDRGVKTTVVGTVYGLDFEIEGEGYSVSLFFDHYNQRLKVIGYEAVDYTALIGRLSWLAEANGFDKIFVKAGPDDFQQFLSHGYLMEGVLRYYFRGEDAYVLSRFSSSERIRNDNVLAESQLIEKLIYESERNEERRPEFDDVSVLRAQPEHIPLLVALYRAVFETYPSPLKNPDYINATMERNVVYRVAMREGRAVAAASAEINTRHSNAEMTDCATLPAARGRGLMRRILSELEEDLRERRVMTAYTLARAMSVGMNRVFYALDYEYSGRLINNCDIFGRFEDMNIWVKKLGG